MRTSLSLTVGAAAMLAATASSAFAAPSVRAVDQSRPAVESVQYYGYYGYPYPYYYGYPYYGYWYGRGWYGHGWYGRGWHGRRW